MSKSYWYVMRVKYFMGDFQKNENFMLFFNPTKGKKMQKRAARNHTVNLKH